MSKKGKGIKLQLQLVLYNALVKALIIGAIGFLLPSLIREVVFDHIDNRLKARSEKLMEMVKRGGISEILLDEDCSFDSYSILKEEYVSISPLQEVPQHFGDYAIQNATRIIESEVLNHRVLSHAFLYDNQLYNLEIGEGLRSIDELNRTISSFTVKFMILVLVASVLLDFFLARRRLRPFYKIVNTKLQDLNHPASFNKTPIKTDTYEFRYLDDSINKMMQKVNDAFTTEKEFIQNASHELLTPISIIQNRMENMITEPDLPDDVAMKLVDTQKTLLRLTRVIKSLLYISKIENEQFLRNESVHIKSLINDVVEELEDRIVQKEINFKMDCKEEYVFNHSNKALLHTMIFNLLSNAIKYNKPKGEIRFSDGFENNSYFLSIADSGEGIEPENLNRIFDRFKRFKPEDDNSFGIGLPIVKKIATFHNIQISVNSKLGEGCRFDLFFPKK